jgi:hypothetical protein
MPRNKDNEIIKIPKHIPKTMHFKRNRKKVNVGQACLKEK